MLLTWPSCPPLGIVEGVGRIAWRIERRHHWLCRILLELQLNIPSKADDTKARMVNANTMSRNMRHYHESVSVQEIQYKETD